MKRPTYIKAGNFKLTTTHALLSDPGYEKRARCVRGDNLNISVQNCRKGNWTAYVVKRNHKYTYDGEIHNDWRIDALFAAHSSVIAPEGCFDFVYWENDKIAHPYWQYCGDVWVDSGQAGIFDEAKFGDNEQFSEEGACGFGDKWYSNMCDLTLARESCGVLECGVNAAAGFGDGEYPCFKHYKNGKIDALCILFNPDVDDQEATENAIIPTGYSEFCEQVEDDYAERRFELVGYEEDGYAIYRDYVLMRYFYIEEGVERAASDFFEVELANSYKCYPDTLSEEERTSIEEKVSGWDYTGSRKISDDGEYEYMWFREKC